MNDPNTIKRENGVKTCSKCEAAPRVSKTSSYCKKCNAAYQKDRYYNHPGYKQKKLKNGREWAALNNDKILEYARASYAKYRLLHPLTRRPKTREEEKAMRRAINKRQRERQRALKTVNIPLENI